MSNIEKTQSNIVESVVKRVEQLTDLGQLQLPKDYSAVNAIRAAWMVLQDNPSLLTKTTKPSQMQALFKMVVMGLSVAKGQGNFIAYGDKLNFNPMYAGNKLLAKRWAGVKNVSHNTVYQGDIFEYEIDSMGRKQLKKHEQKLENIDMNKIVAAYCIVVHSDDTTEMKVMSKQQITQAWLQGPMKGQSPAHKNFPDMMSEKTVANRVLTMIYRASDDGAILDAIENEENTQLSQKEVTTPRKEKTISFDEPSDVEYEDNEPQAEEEKKPEPTPAPKPEKKKEQPKKEAQKQGKDLFDSEEPF